MSRTTATTTSSNKNSCRANLEEYLEALLGFDDVSALLDHLLLLPRLDARSYLSDLIGSITNDTKNTDLESFLDKMQDYQSGARSVPPMYAIPSTAGSTPSTEKHSGNSRLISGGSTNEFQRSHPKAQVSGSASTTNTKRTDQTTSRAAGSTTTQSNFVLHSKRYNGPETRTKKNVVQPIIGRKNSSSSSSVAAATEAAGVTTTSSNIQSSSVEDNSTNDRKNKRVVMVRNHQGIRYINRKECGCYGTIHDCYTNCLDCGRIACVEEGYGECFFCGTFLPSDMNHTMATTSTHDIVRKSGTTVEREKQQWLQRDREFAQRTVVLDDDQVALPGDSYWLDNQERRKAQAAEDQRRKELHSKKKEIQMLITL